jgi:hypothetical protein
MFKFTGAVKAIFDTQQVTEKFAKREFVVTDTANMYPQDILFQLTQDKCNMVDGVNTGDMIEVSFNLRGREWTSPQGEVKYFNTLEAWRVEKVGAAQPAPGAMPQGGPSPMDFAPQATSTTSFDSATSEAEGDDLPF